ncbi:MAG: hypothetical protein L6V93_20545 [Clostridiales bacterium]|nr:MAG: hypothetical protein L6V93_20545 [Clostridiales bacterium]
MQAEKNKFGVFQKNAGCNFWSEKYRKSTVFDASDGCGACLEMIIDFIDKNCADGKKTVVRQSALKQLWQGKSTIRAL